MTVQLLFTCMIGLLASALATSLAMNTIDRPESAAVTECSPSWVEPVRPDDSELWKIKEARDAGRTPRTEVRFSLDGFPTATTDRNANFKMLNEIRFGTPKRIQSLYWWLNMGAPGDEVTLALPAISEDEAGYIKHWAKKFPDLRINVESYFTSVLAFFPDFHSELLLLELKTC